MTTRKKNPREFKLEAVSLALDQGYTDTDAAKSLEINRSVLQRWIKDKQLAAKLPLIKI